MFMCPNLQAKCSHGLKYKIEGYSILQLCLLLHYSIKLSLIHIAGGTFIAGDAYHVDATGLATFDVLTYSFCFCLFT